MSKSEYLAALFAKGTLGDIHEVLALRAQYLHVKSPRPATTSDESGQSREQISAGLIAMGESFYDTDQAELFDRLEGISSESFPDLDRFKKRLEKVAERLPTIWDADGDSALDPRLWKNFKALLVAPHSQATEEKRKISQSMTKRAALRRTVKFAKLIKRSYPELFALESAWFGNLTAGKKVAKDSRRPTNVGLGCLGAYGAFYLISKVVRMLLTDE